MDKMNKMKTEKKRTTKFCKIHGAIETFEDDKYCVFCKRRIYTQEEILRKIAKNKNVNCLLWLFLSNNKELQKSVLEEIVKDYPNCKGVKNG
jgi:glucosamine 6-phosphate synthetase-like amidotransferase/phosphosugar isomerase protein